MAIKSDNELKLSLASLRLFDCNNTPLVVLDKVRLASQIRQLELKKNHMPVSERKIDAKVGFWYVNL